MGLVLPLRNAAHNQLHFELLTVAFSTSWSGYFFSYLEVHPVHDSPVLWEGHCGIKKKKLRKRKKKRSLTSHIQVNLVCAGTYLGQQLFPMYFNWRSTKRKGANFLQPCALFSLEPMFCHQKFPAKNFGEFLSPVEFPAIEILLQGQRVVSKKSSPPCLYASSAAV